MQFTFTITKGQQHAPYLIRASLLTFLLICLVALGACLLLLGLLLQAGALAAPWLIGNGLAVIKAAAALFIAFRLLLLISRMMRRLHRGNKQHTWYTTFLATLRGTGLYLVTRLVYLLLG